MSKIKLKIKKLNDRAKIPNYAKKGDAGIDLVATTTMSNGYFIEYGTDIVEPLWSFEQYFEFILVILVSTGFVFQIPIIQYLLGFFGLFTGKQMLGLWKYVIVLSTIVSAILTPSTDPITQSLLSFAFISLYLAGASLVIFIENNKTLIKNE